MLEYGRFYLELGTHLSEKGGGGGNISSFLQLKTPKENEDEPVTADLKTLDHGISA